jgi:hypothetical protein
MRALTTAFLISLLATFATAQPTSKPAWEWTLDERIAKRIDPKAIRDRAIAEEKDLVERGGFKPEELVPVNFVINGRFDPELFLPSELFNVILEGVWSSRETIAADIRKTYRPHIVAAGWEEELFWKTIEEGGARYWKLVDERVAMELAALTQPRTRTERRTLTSEGEALEIPACRIRAETLQDVREKLGTARFDRFLYEVVAPRIIIGSSTGISSAEDWQLRYVEGGCR